MIRIATLFGKTIALTTVCSLLICLVPGMALAEAHDAVAKSIPKPKPAPAPSKLLSAKRMGLMQGRAGENPYASGQSKWDVVYKGVDIMTGNFTTSGTDLTFEGGYGIPVNVTRSYSANNGEEGPLGKGWTLSVDVRSTAGGIMKSAAAPVRSIPVNFKERPTAQVDPNIVFADGAVTGTGGAQPIQAVLATDAGGTEETIQRDADGILSTPPWDKNKVASEYDSIVKPDGSVVQVMKRNWVNTPEGTVYLYEKQGEYSEGIRPYGVTTGSAEVSYVLKIKTATDRQGSVTTYNYNSNVNVTFNKANGTAVEHPLTSIQMPNGHSIAFTWGTGVNSNRVIKASDGYRDVLYSYSDGFLSSVSTPEGKTTTYEYGSAPGVNMVRLNGTTPWTGPVANGILKRITDPRGLSTYIYSVMMYDQGLSPKVGTFKLKFPNGTSTAFTPYASSGSGVYGSNFPDEFGYDTSSVAYTPNFPGYQRGQVVDFIEATGKTFNFGYISRSIDYSAKTYTVGKSFAPNWIVDNYTAIGSTVQSDVYNLMTGDLLTGQTMTHTAGICDSVIDSSYWDSNPLGRPMTGYFTSTQASYNFIGNPLNKKTTVSTVLYNQQGNPPSPVVNEVGYAYWGADKYYQQKTVRDQGGRLSYTDYYPNAAAAGKRGQTYRVYDQKRANVYVDPNIIVPSYASAATAWRYQIVLADPSKYSAQFDYDSKGRAIDVWKIQRTDTSPWTYVRTNTTYGADSAPTWGAATQVLEDFGGINRTTQTLEYDSCGRAIQAVDASGKRFKTNYDKDGVVQSIQKYSDSGSWDNLVTYVYGTTGISNGAVLNVTDNLSGVSQNLTYCNTGGGIGRVASVSETADSGTYGSAYTYNTAGDRETAIYTTQAVLGQPSSVGYRYESYRTYGDPTGGSRACRRMTKIDPSTGVATSEAFNYNYDSSGRIQAATFAMTPKSSVTAPLSNGSWYDSSNPAQTRGRAYYEYLQTGQLKGIYHWWDTLQGNGAYNSQFIRGNECDYEITSGFKRGLKTASRTIVPVVNYPLNWQTQRTETYSYDSNLDYLVGANYGDGLANANVTWGYDAAGNRVSDSANAGSWTYDNLNRMTTSPGASYENDIVGNRSSKTAINRDNYEWDLLNRLTKFKSGQNAQYLYMYRADGLRVQKGWYTGVSGINTTVYRYDGQMGIEDLSTDRLGVVTELHRTTLGARGVDMMATSISSGTSITYPLYDSHGNMVGQLAKSGSSFVVGNEKSYDAWGGVRAGDTSLDPKGRYCANLGHKQDDESGLVYMRARYYEPGTGRFVSEDVTGDGNNWYSYARSNPVSGVDFTGKAATFDLVSGSVDEIMEKLQEAKFFQGAKSQMANKVESLLYREQGVIAHFLDGDATTMTIKATGVELNGATNTATVFVDCTSYDALANGVHLDFQLLGQTGARAFMEGFFMESGFESWFPWG